MYGGIHFRFDNETGLMVGAEVGQYVLQRQLLPLKGGRGLARGLPAVRR